MSSTSDDEILENVKRATRQMEFGTRLGVLKSALPTLPYVGTLQQYGEHFETFRGLYASGDLSQFTGWPGFPRPTGWWPGEESYQLNDILHWMVAKICLRWEKFEPRGASQESNHNGVHPSHCSRCLHNRSGVSHEGVAHEEAYCALSGVSLEILNSISWRVYER